MADKKKTLLDVYNTMNADQKLVVEYLVGLIGEDMEDDKDLEQSGVSLEEFLTHHGVKSAEKNLLTKEENVDRASWLERLFKNEVRTSK